MDKIIQIIATELNIKKSQVENTIKLIDEGNTIPFIARYRKEVTGGLSDEVLRTFGERLNYLRNLEKRKEEVTNSINEQGKLTEEIVKDLENAVTLAEVEDIYRPYKQKKKTRATVAKAKGLEPLAEIILAQEETKDIQEIATEYINEEKEVKDKIQDFGPAQFLQTLGLILLALYLFLSAKFGESELLMKITILAAEICMVASLFLLIKNHKKLTRLVIWVIGEFAVTTILMLMHLF